MEIRIDFYSRPVSPLWPILSALHGVAFVCMDYSTLVGCLFQSGTDRTRKCLRFSCLPCSNHMFVVDFAINLLVVVSFCTSPTNLIRFTEFLSGKCESSRLPSRTQVATL